MVAPLKKKHTIEQSSFTFNDDYFKYSRNKYSYEDIIELRIVRTRLELRTIGVGSDYSYGIGVEIKMNDNEMLKLIEQPTMFSKEDLENIKYIEEFIEIASHKSWENRVKNYSDQVNKKGYFTYANWNLYIEDEILFDKKTDKEYQLNSINLGKRYGVLVINNKKKSFTDKLIGSISGKEILIDTLTNTDVFFALLKHYFKLSWS
jgi:hypothetical protein